MTSHDSHLPCAFGRQAEMGNPPKEPVVREGRQAHKSVIKIRCESCNTRAVFELHGLQGVLSSVVRAGRWPRR